MTKIIEKLSHLYAHSKALCAKHWEYCIEDDVKDMQEFLLSIINFYTNDKPCLPTIEVTDEKTFVSELETAIAECSEFVCNKLLDLISGVNNDDCLWSIQDVTSLMGKVLVFVVKRNTSVSGLMAMAETFVMMSEKVIASKTGLDAVLAYDIWDRMEDTKQNLKRLRAEGFVANPAEMICSIPAISVHDYQKFRHMLEATGLTLYHKHNMNALLF